MTSKCKKFHLKEFAVFLVLICYFVIHNGCATKGLVSKNYDPISFRIPKLPSWGKIAEKDPAFILYGDTQTGWHIRQKFLKKENWLTWKMLLFPFYEIYWLANGIYGGINFLRASPDYGNKEFEMVRNAIYSQTEQTPIDFILNVGDLVSDGRRPKHWESFFKSQKQNNPLFDSVPFLSTRGNHERSTDPRFGGPNYETIFIYPGFYVLEFPNVSVFVLDSQIILDGYQNIPDDQQDKLFTKWIASDNDSESPAWLETQLKEKKTRFKIIVMHHPPVSFGHHHNDWNKQSYGRDLLEKRKTLLHLFLKYKVNVVFSGHEHFYEHSIVRSTTNKTNDGQNLHIIVAGSGGAPIRDFMNKKEIKKAQSFYRKQGFIVEPVIQESIYNYILVQVNSENIDLNILKVTEDPHRPIESVEQISIQ